ncbi:MAG: SDR family NAD(P)-dependent oxidoreductase [Eubacteriales bacterium]|nr:SDR family NAD(P)-dependent oxidoreductase [Eubacteriales bacterium]
MRLQDKVIVVTGSTKGIGAAIAKVCAAEGAKVVVSGRSKADGECVLAQIVQAGGDARFIQCDVSNVDSVRTLIEGTVQAYGRIDGLVNNAGVFPRVSLLDVTESDYESVMEINVKGAFFCAQSALRYMIEQHCGSIVNIGSTHWRMGGPTQPVYSMSKGALHTLTQHIAQHFCRKGIRCNWVTVGWVLSDGEMDLTRSEGHNEAYLQKMLPMAMPSGRFQTGEDIAMACVYLLSDEATQVTGTDIEVTGGFKPEAIPTIDLSSLQGK